jgi:hypothetical protein
VQAQDYWRACFFRADNNLASHHQKIIRDFAEMLVLYWLSKSGHKCARIDHIGIDIIAAAQDGADWNLSATLPRSRHTELKRQPSRV